MLLEVTVCVRGLCGPDFRVGYRFCLREMVVEVLSDQIAYAHAIYKECSSEQWMQMPAYSCLLCAGHARSLRTNIPLKVWKSSTTACEMFRRL